MPGSTHRNPKRRRWFRILVRTLFIVMALAAAAAIGIYFSPLSFRALDRRIADGISSALDVHVSFDRATVRLSTRHIQLQDVRLSLPTQPAASEVQLASLELVTRHALFPLPSQWSFSRIQLSDLSEIALQRTDDGWRASPVLEQILTSLQKQPPSPDGRSSPDLMQITLKGLRIEDHRRDAVLPTLRLRPVDIALQVQSDGDWSLDAKTSLVGRDSAAPVHIFLDGEGDRPECRYFVKLESFATKDFLSLGSPIAYQCDNLSFEGKVSFPPAPSDELKFDVRLSATPSVLETFRTPRRFDLPELQ
ncbi:MAG: hypothetical protein V2A74_15135, partial [bacterium]